MVFVFWCFAGRIVYGEGHLVQKDKMSTVIRYKEAPTPNGCRYCGYEQRAHGNCWVRSVGWHFWVEPTNAQRLARMKARMKAR